MAKVLVTGGRGGLGSAVVRRLVEAGWVVRVMSQRPAPTDLDNRIEWARGDLKSGDGLREAVDGIGTIVHSATNPVRDTRAVDVEGTAKLLAAARQADVAHVIYPSIVGIEKVSYSYYQQKVAGEARVKESGIPWTIARFTQFYSLIDRWMGRLASSPLIPLPADLLLQPMHHHEAAADLVARVGRPAEGMAPDMGGPRLYELDYLARRWLVAHAKRRFVVTLPLFPSLLAPVRDGALTCPQGIRGVLSWEEWLANRTGGGVAETGRLVRL